MIFFEKIRLIGIEIKNLVSIKVFTLSKARFLILSIEVYLID